MLEGGANIPHIDTGPSAAFESEIKRASPVKEVRPVAVLSSIIYVVLYVYFEWVVRY